MRPTAHEPPRESWVQTLPAHPNAGIVPDEQRRQELAEMAAALAANPGAYRDPWEGFYGAFESPYPDLVERHDYYASRTATNEETSEKGE